MTLVTKMAINYLNDQSLEVLKELLKLQELYYPDMPQKQFDSYYNKILELCDKKEYLEWLNLIKFLRKLN